MHYNESAGMDDFERMIKGFDGYNTTYSPTNMSRSQVATIFGRSRVMILLDDRDSAQNENLNDYGKNCLPHRTVDCIGGHQRQGRNDLSDC